MRKGPDARRHRVTFQAGCAARLKLSNPMFRSAARLRADVPPADGARRGPCAGRSTSTIRAPDRRSAGAGRASDDHRATTTGKATVRAIKLLAPLVVDGRLDEDVYTSNPPFGDLIQVVPATGQPATERTDLWLMFDDKNIYVAARVHDSAPPEQVGRQRISPRHQPAAPERPHRHRPRHLLRPAQRLHVLRHAARRLLRLLDHRRGPARTPTGTRCGTCAPAASTAAGRWR